EGGRPGRNASEAIEPRDSVNRRPTRSKTWKAPVGSRKRRGGRRLRRGLRARHGRIWKRHGTWEIHDGLERDRSSRPTEWTIHRKADAVVEVGSAGSTRRAGKPRTRGSGGAGRGAGPGTHPLRAEVGVGCPHNWNRLRPRRRQTAHFVSRRWRICS